MAQEVRTRFAPSPTGYMHIGNLRTALYAYLIAKKNHGTFILRIEDTDQERLVEGATDIIYDTLRETGLLWDEGPDIGGPVGPYVQSQRQDSYLSYAEQLVAEGKAYYCFCDKERLDRLREEQKAAGQDPMYDGHCQHLTAQEIEEKRRAGVPYVIRQKMPKTGTTTFHDEVFGDITVENAVLEDQILIKSDGMPTYNFANVIDDHLMGITHVIRGNEYLSSTPKYNLLYEALGFPIPKYVHCPPVMKDQHNKLSKRNGDASYGDLIEKGYLTGAVLNYIALLGWSPKGEQEIFSLPELVEAFDIGGISKSPAIFDPLKLNHINAEYIRALDDEAFYQIALPWMQKAVHREGVDWRLLAQGLHKRTEVLGEIPPQLDFVDELPTYSTELYISKKMKTDETTSLDALQKVLPVLAELDDFSHDSVHAAVFALVERLGVKNGYILGPLRTAASGKGSTPCGGTEICAILGKEETIRRIQVGIRLLKEKLGVE